MDRLASAGTNDSPACPGDLFLLIQHHQKHTWIFSVIPDGLNATLWGQKTLKNQPDTTDVIAVDCSAEKHIKRTYV